MKYVEAAIRIFLVFACAYGAYYLVGFLGEPVKWAVLGILLLAVIYLEANKPGSTS